MIAILGRAREGQRFSPRGPRGDAPAVLHDLGPPVEGERAGQLVAPCGRARRTPAVTAPETTRTSSALGTPTNWIRLPYQSDQK